MYRALQGPGPPIIGPIYGPYSLGELEFGSEGLIEPHGALSGPTGPFRALWALPPPL